MANLLNIISLLVLLSLVLCDGDCGFGWTHSKSSTQYFEYCTAHHEKTYGRGAGYGAKLGEFNLKNAKKRCEEDNEQGCEKNGLVYYPKCANGWSQSGCCVCTYDHCPKGYDYALELSDDKVTCIKQ